MRAYWKVVVALLVVAAFPWQAHAGWGGPYYRGGWYGYGYGYGYPFGVYVVPPPVVVTPVGPPPVVVAPPAPSVTVAPAPAPALDTTPTPLVVRVGEVDQLLVQLNDADAKVRASAAVQLGRLHVRRAIDPLSRMLGSDPSPVAREAAARGLGLIGLPGGLGALQRAAQADDDPEVRHSAQFAAEGIRARLRGQ